MRRVWLLAGMTLALGLAPGTLPPASGAVAAGVVSGSVVTATARAPLPATASPAPGAVDTVEDVPRSLLSASARPPVTAPPWVPEPPIYAVLTEWNVPVRTADGTVLRVNVLYPGIDGKRAPGPFPVLLTQTPYGKAVFGPDLYFVQRGFIEVVADVRGTGASHGSWGLLDPVQIDDGAALVRWAAGLPRSNGRVGLFGASYLGINQLLTAAAVGPNSPLKAIFPMLAATDVYRDLAVMGGLFDREFDSMFLGITGGDNTTGPGREAVAAGLQSASPQDVMAVELEHLAGLPASHAAFLAEVETGGERAFDGPYWATRRPRDALAAIVANGIPAYMVGGWHDIFQRGEPLNYAGLQNAWARRPVDAPMAPGQRVTGRYQLLMGPWYHVAPSGEEVERLQLEWFDTWLRGEPTGMADTPTPLHLYEMGAKRVLDSTTWPLPHAVPQQWYLGAGKSGTAPWSVNDGDLGPARPQGGEDAVAFAGASEPCSASSEQWSGGAPRGALANLGGPEDPCLGDDRPLQAAPTALAYTSAPFAQRVMLAGPIGATIFAASTTRDCEWVVTVDDVADDGASTPLTQGALLGSMRALDAAHSWWTPGGGMLLPVHPLTGGSIQAVTPDEITRYDIEVLPTLASIAAGHRLRVTITTSDTPHLLPSAGQFTNLVGGVYKVQHNRALASFVELPLAGEGAP